MRNTAFLVLGVALLGAFVIWELANPSPMLDMRLFGNRSFAVGSGTILAQYFATLVDAKDVVAAWNKAAS